MPYEVSLANLPRVYINVMNSLGTEDDVIRVWFVSWHMCSR